MKKIAYIHDEVTHNDETPSAVVPVIIDLVRPASVLDVGCGTGNWLKAFEVNGVVDYLGVDGPYVDAQTLKIPDGKFLAHNLEEPLSIGRKFDLVMSLEVAEHIAGEFADTFVQTLVTHGDTILFSAAIPGQGGQHHVNEQWPEYWQMKFEKHGFHYHDVVRPRIWDNADVQWWYKQNIFLLKRNREDRSSMPLAIVHPTLHNLTRTNHAEMLESLERGEQGLKISFRIFVSALLFKLKSLFRS